MCAGEDQPIGGLLLEAEAMNLFYIQAVFEVQIHLYPRFLHETSFLRVLLKDKWITGLGHFVSEVGGVGHTRNYVIIITIVV